MFSGSHQLTEPHIFMCIMIFEVFRQYTYIHVNIRIKVTYDVIEVIYDISIGLDTFLYLSEIPCLYTFFIEHCESRSV